MLILYLMFITSFLLILLTIIVFGSLYIMNEGNEVKITSININKPFIHYNHQYQFIERNKILILDKKVIKGKNLKGKKVLISRNDKFNLSNKIEDFDRKAVNNLIYSNDFIFFKPRKWKSYSIKLI